MPNPFNPIPMPAPPITSSNTTTTTTTSSHLTTNLHDSDSEDRFMGDNGDVHSDISGGIQTPQPISTRTTTTTVNNSNTATLPATTMAGGLAGGGIGGLTGGAGGAVGGIGGTGVAINGGQPLNGVTAGQYHPPGSVINLSNSSDVVIGPMTQYQGAVTIYQYMDATVETSHRRGPVSLGLKGNNNNSNNNNIQSNNGEPTTVPKKKCSVFDLQNIQTWLLITVLIIIGVGVGIAIYLALLKNIVQNNNNEYQPTKQREILFGNEYEDDTIPNLGDGHLVIDRKQWGARDIYYNTTISHLNHPIPKIIITHIGVQSKPCDTVYNCSIKMRTIQDAAIAEKGYTDLSANFYVSNDGYIYVGRGWNVTNVYANESLAVCFMGDYVRFEPTQRQLDGALYLLAYGVARQFITPNYLLIAHNQTKTTKSPGPNVYKKIIRWPHWYSCGVNGKPKCEW